MTRASISPARRASSVSSASLRRASTARRSRSGRFLRLVLRMRASRVVMWLPGLHFEADEYPLGIRKVSDDLPEGRRQAPDERRYRDDLIAPRERRIFCEI